MHTRRSAPTSFAEKQVFTTGEAAQVCGVSQQTIIRCFDSGRLRGFRVPGSRFRRIPRGNLLQFIKDNGIPPEVLGARRPRVLIVDDDEAILALVEEVLKMDGSFDVETASTGYEAGIQTERFQPDVLLLDFMLPDINGNEVCKRIRENKSTASTQVVIVSGAVSRKEIEGVLADGANSFIAKPFDPMELLERVRELVGV